MKCCACRGVGSGIASIAILFGLGAAGYNTVRTGCPLGNCCGEACEQTQAAPAPVVAPVAKPAAPTSVPDGVKPVQPEAGSPR